MHSNKLTTRILAGMVLGLVFGLGLMRFFPVGVQPGDTLSLSIHRAPAIEVQVGGKDTPPEKGVLELPDGTRLNTTGKTPAELLADIQARSTLAVEAVRVTDRKEVSVTPPITQVFYVAGEFFLRLLRMVIIPLIASTVLIGITGLGSFSRMGRLGRQTIIFYAATSFIAVIIGILVVNIVRPGDGLGWTIPDNGTGLAAATPTIPELMLRIVPSNPVDAMARMDVLGTLFFVIILALAILKIGKEKAAPLIAFFESLNEVVYVIIGWIMALAPVGVGALLAYFLGIQDPSYLATLAGGLSKFALCVVLGLLIHFVVLTVLVRVFGKQAPRAFIRQATPPLTTALGTASSNATLPVTLSASREMGVSGRISGFVIPVGATANMDGTALYEATAVLFFAQAFGIGLSIPQQGIVAITAMLAAVGAAGIPSAGLVTMALVLTAVGLPLTGIGLLLAIDRPLDMLRTSINVYGDLATCRVVQTWNPDIRQDQDEEAAAV